MNPRKKQKFEIIIEETITQEFELYAVTAEEAIELAVLKYKMDEFVLDSGEVQHKQLAIIEPADEITEWIEF